MYLLKHSFTIISLAFLTNCALAQQSNSYDLKNNFWYNWNEPIRKKLQLAPLVVTQPWFHWRLWFNGQELSYVIDIQGADTYYNGSVTIYTQEYISSKTSIADSTRMIYYEVANISLNANKIYDLIIKNGLSAIPTSELIDEWGQGNDGVTYNIEQREGGNQTFKSYWSPTAVKAPEAKVIQNFVVQLSQVIGLKTLLNSFSGHVPFDSYNTGGPMTIVKLPTALSHPSDAKELEHFKKSKKLRFQTAYGYLIR